MNMHCFKIRRNKYTSMKKVSCCVWARLPHVTCATLRQQPCVLCFLSEQKGTPASLKMESICATLSIEIRFKYRTPYELHRQSRCLCFIFAMSASTDIIFGSCAWESTLPNRVEGGGRQHNGHSPHVSPCSHSSIRKCMHIYSFSFQIL